MSTVKGTKPQTSRNYLYHYLHTGERLQTTRNYTSLNALTHQQKQVVDKIARVRRFMVYHATGTGKTRIGVEIAKDYIHSGAQHIVIFVTPASVGGQFSRELTKINHDGRVFFLTYDNLEKLIEGNYNNTTQTYSKELFTSSVLHNTMVIFDEAHNIDLNKVRVLKGAHKIVLMTATPFINQISDLFTYIQLLNPDITFNSSLKGKSVSNLAEYFRGRVSVMNKLNNNVRFPKLSGPTYIKVNTNLANNIKNIKWSGVSKVYLNQQKFFDNQRVINPKYAVFDKIYNESGKKRTIAYFENTGTLLNFKHYLDQLYPGIRIGVVTGETNLTTRANMVKNLGVNVYLISHAGATGLDFKNITNIIFMEIPFTRCLFDQIVGRGVRYLKNTTANRPTVHVYVLYIQESETSMSNQLCTPNSHRMSILNNKTKLQNAIHNALTRVSIQRVNSTVNNNTGRTSVPYTFNFNPGKRPKLHVYTHRKQEKQYPAVRGVPNGYYRKKPPPKEQEKPPPRERNAPRLVRRKPNPSQQ